MRIYVIIIVMLSLFACQNEKKNDTKPTNNQEKLKIAVFSGDGAGETAKNQRIFVTAGSGPDREEPECVYERYRLSIPGLVAETHWPGTDPVHLS